MGLAFEILFLFVAINYLAVEFIKGKATSSECRKRIAETDAVVARSRELREYAENVEGVVCPCIYTGEDPSKIRRDEEREVVEVLRTLPSWKDIKSWNKVSDSRCEYLRGKRREEEEYHKWMYMNSIIEIIYFANRGKIPICLLCIDRYGYLFSYCSFDKVKELMIWWRNKIRDMGVNHELWFCYDEPIEINNGKVVYSGTKRCRCPVEFASSSFQNGRYCWDTEIWVIDSELTKQPSDFVSQYKIEPHPAHWFTVSAISTDYIMRLPTSGEWTRLCESYDLLNKPKFDVRGSSMLANHMEGTLAVKSSLTRREKYSNIKDDHLFSEIASKNFRPAFEMRSGDIYERMSYEVGEEYVIGTLYMEGIPIRITTGDPPIEVSRDKRGVKRYEDPPIEHYKVASILELGEPREDPQYQIVGIYIGDGVFISRDILLDSMSQTDVTWSINKAKELRALADNKQ